MAMVCAHCGSADVQFGLRIWQCLGCGRYTTDDQERTLPDSLLIEPNQAEALAQHGWPIADTRVLLERAAQLQVDQGYVPFDPALHEGTVLTVPATEVAMSDPTPEPAPQPEPAPAPEPEPAPEPPAPQEPS